MPHRRGAQDDRLGSDQLWGALAAVILAFVAKPHRTTAAVAGGLSAAAGPVVWNAILRAAHGNQFFTDAPVAVIPASWQDTGSGGFALATATLVVGLVALPTVAARRVAGYAAICGLTAFLVDVYRSSGVTPNTLATRRHRRTAGNDDR